MALRFVQQLSAGESTPFGYGVAWVDHYRGSFVAMPVPFNVLARVLRDVWLYLAYPGPVNPRAAYRDGYRAGRASMAADLHHAGVISRADRNERETPCA